MNPRRAVGRALVSPRVALAVALAGLGAAPASAAPPKVVPQPITVSADGERPNVLVDQAGTAHVVWNQSTPQGSADILHYCRIARGARACAGEQTFVPPEAPAEANKDTTGPRIVQTGPDQIVLLTHRYPAVVVSEEPDGRPNPQCFDQRPLDQCFGSSNNSTWAYVGSLGGQSFGPPKLLGTGHLSGPPIVLTVGPDAPRIATVSDTFTGGTFFQAVRPDGYTRAQANLGDEGRDRAYSGSVAAFGGSVPIVAFADLTPDVYVRGYRSGPTNDVAGWGPSVSAGRGSEPRLAGGARGTYLLYKARAGAASRYVVKRVLDASGAVSSTSVPVSGIGDVVGRDLFADGGANLHAAWVLRDGTTRPLRYRFGPTATSFGETLALSTGRAAQVNGVDLSAADDGRGFAVWASTVDGRGVIRATPLGPVANLFTVLRVPARISRRARTVSIRVAAARPATLTVNGRDFAVGPRAQRLRLSIRRGRSKLTLALTLAAGGEFTAESRSVVRR